MGLVHLPTGGRSSGMEHLEIPEAHGRVAHPHQGGKPADRIQASLLYQHLTRIPHPAHHYPWGHRPYQCLGRRSRQFETTHQFYAEKYQSHVTVDQRTAGVPQDSKPTVAPLSRRDRHHRLSAQHLPDFQRDSRKPTHQLSVLYSRPRV